MRTHHFIIVTTLVGLSSCKPKPSEAPEASAGSQSARPPVTSIREDSSRPTSYESLREMERKEMSRFPLTKDASDREFRALMTRRKDLLFSVPLNAEATEDRKRIWDLLEPDGCVNERQLEYVKELSSKYSTANHSPIEKLVMWEVIRTCNQFKTRKEFNAYLEVHMGYHGTRLMLSAMGIDATELINAVQLEVRGFSREARARGNQAEDELDKLQPEYQGQAERILEKAWTKSPS